MAKALADAEENHKKELAASLDAAEKEKQEYLERFLQSEAFCHSTMFACNGLFKKAIFMLYRDFAKAYPVLPEEVGVRDYSDQEMEIPTGYLATCRWDEERDRLVDPEGEPVEHQLNRKSCPATGFRTPFPADRWPVDFPRPPPGGAAGASTSQTPPPSGTRYLSYNTFNFL